MVQQRMQRRGGVVVVLVEEEEEATGWEGGARDNRMLLSHQVLCLF